jgi:hypothetical protein
LQCTALYSEISYTIVLKIDREKMALLIAELRTANEEEEEEEGF